MQTCIGYRAHGSVLSVNTKKGAVGKHIGIVGNGTDKFTVQGEKLARQAIIEILTNEVDPILVSGHSPVGGIDIWAEEFAELAGYRMDLKIPSSNKWDAKYGYKQRNLDIAKSSDKLYSIVVDSYPPEYDGMRFKQCYHCFDSQPWHVKSGACWTAKKALALGKEVEWIHILNNGSSNKEE